MATLGPDDLLLVVSGFGMEPLTLGKRMLERLTSSDEDLVGRTALLVDDDARNIFALSSVLEPGDELLMVDSVYGPTRMFCDQVLKAQGIATRYYDPLSGPAEVEAMLTTATTTIVLERRYGPKLPSSQARLPPSSSIEASSSGARVSFVIARSNVASWPPSRWSSPTAPAARSTPSAWPSSTARRGTAARSSTRAVARCA